MKSNKSNTKVIINFLGGLGGVVLGVQGWQALDRGSFSYGIIALILGICAIINAIKAQEE